MKILLLIILLATLNSCDDYDHDKGKYIRNYSTKHCLNHGGSKSASTNNYGRLIILCNDDTIEDAYL